MLFWTELERGTLMGRARWIGAAGRSAALGNAPIRGRVLLASCGFGCILYQGLCILFLSRAGVTHGSVPIVRDPIDHLLLVSVLVVLAPLSEELTFRGWLWTGLRRHWSPFVTTGVTALFWAVMHLPKGLWYVALLLPMGLLLGFVRAQTQSVRGPLILHMTFNLAAIYMPSLMLRFGWV
jgi:membrane protease YdiL (CAAX protease family)